MAETEGSIRRPQVVLGCVILVFTGTLIAGGILLERSDVPDQSTITQTATPNHVILGTPAMTPGFEIFD